MRNGSWTTLIVVTGTGRDPLNDKNVSVGFYVSNDKMVKDGNGGIARDYTFRIKPHAKYEAIFAARTSKGVIVSTAAADVMLRDPSYTQDLELLRARINLQMQADGSLEGHVGGYRPWEPVYRGWVNARGTVIESLTWVQLPAVYYALQRNADFAPPGAQTKTHISFALRVDAVPAFIMTPAAEAQATNVVSYKARAQAEPVLARERPGFSVIDGIVIDRNARVQAGPNAVILPPESAIQRGQ